MKQTKPQRVKQKDWKIGSVSEFLGLSPEEETYIELRLALSRSVKERRNKKSLTQKQLATKIGSSQSRIAKLEAGNKSVSLDMLVRSLFALGASMEELSEIIAKAPFSKSRQPKETYEQRGTDETI